MFLPSSRSRRSADPCLNDAFRTPFLTQWPSLSGQHPLSPALDGPTRLGNTHPHGGKGRWKVLSTRTVHLNGWHRVFANAEKASRELVFLD